MDLCVFRPNNITLINLDVPSWPSTPSKVSEISLIAPKRASASVLAVVSSTVIAATASGDSVSSGVLAFATGGTGLSTLDSSPSSTSSVGGTFFSSTMAVFCGCCSAIRESNTKTRQKVLSSLILDQGSHDSQNWILSLENLISNENQSSIQWNPTIWKNHKIKTNTSPEISKSNRSSRNLWPKVSVRLVSNWNLTLKGFHLNLAMPVSTFTREKLSCSSDISLHQRKPTPHSRSTKAIGKPAH